eukprot:SAG11_NODE_20_length_25330_cov_18.348143_13_plen_481_part_00
MACSHHHGADRHFVHITDDTVQAYSVPEEALGSISVADLCFEEHLTSDDDGSHATRPCCESRPGHMHAHLRADCAAGMRGEALKGQVVLHAETCPSESTEDTCDRAVTQECGHVHSEACSHKTIVHGDHIDYLIPMVEGGYELHHTCSHSIVHCHVHGVLEPLHDGASGSWFVFSACPACPVTKCEQTHHTSGAQEARTTMYVEGICCPSEIPLIERLLQPLPGVIKISVNVPARTTMVDHDSSKTTAADLVLALNSASLGARIHSSLEDVDEDRYPKWNVMLSGVFFLVSMISLAGKKHDADDGSTAEASGEVLCEVCDYFKWVAIAGIVFGWPPILLKAWAALKQCVLDINMLMTLAVAGAIGIEDYVEGAAVVFLFALSEWLETRAGEKARVAIAAVMAMKPEVALLLDDTQLPVEAVAVGTRLKILPGTRVPLDGTVTKVRRGCRRHSQCSCRHSCHPDLAIRFIMVLRSIRKFNL